MTNHKFRVGQIVVFEGRPAPSTAPGDYEVVRLLPPEGGQFLYRIKSRLEQWERVAAEYQLVSPR
jgi:hypothetical protein